MVMINNNMNKEKGSFGEVEHIFHMNMIRI